MQPTYTTSLQPLIEAISDAALLVDHTGTIVLINGAALTLFGYAAADLLGQPIERLMPKAVRARHSQHITHYSHTPRKRFVDQNLDLVAQHADGTVFRVEISLSPLQYADSDYVLAQVFDVSARERHERAQREMERMKQEVEHRRAMLALRERFVAMVTHEYRKPLTNISMAAQVLLRYDGRLPREKYREYLERIGTQVKKMSAMTEDILMMSKMILREATLSPEVVDVERLAREIWQEVWTHPGDHRFVLHNHASLYQFMLDKKVLEYILTNLFSNAIKYSPGGGDVTVTVAYEAEQGWLLLNVADEGIGIDPEAHGQIFEPFYRAPNVSDIPGTGLGLHIVKSGVEVLGGHISVESEPGRGTTFNLKIPVDEARHTP